MRLTGWQRRWVDRTFAPGVRVSALSLSRANGKTALCGWLCAEALRPGSELFDASAEVVIVSASMEQTRTLFGFVQDAIAARGALDDYRFVDSNQRLGVRHKSSGARLRAISSDPKRAMGLSRFKTIIGDEPAAWPDRQGELMYHALRQAVGKREGQRLVLVGTRSRKRQTSTRPGRSKPTRAGSAASRRWWMVSTRTPSRTCGPSSEAPRSRSTRASSRTRTKATCPCSIT